MRAFDNNTNADKFKCLEKISIARKITNEGDKQMSSKFKISEHRNGGNLHLKLSGNFDDDSAQKILDVLAKRHSGIFRIIIHTSSLEHINCLGKTTIQNNLESIHEQVANIVFTGEYANQIA